MLQMKIQEDLKRLSLTERLVVIEAAVQLIRQDLQIYSKSQSELTEEERRLAAAAQALAPDYAAGGDLTAFTDLDSEDFHA